MASLKIISDRCDDNSIKFAVVIPPRRNGTVNFGAVEAVNRSLLSINPDAYDPVPVPQDFHAVDAPMPAHVAEILARQEADDTPEDALNFQRSNPVNQVDEE